MSHLWRPFSLPGAAMPFRLARGDGVTVTDAGGREYLDAAGGLWNLALGLNHGALVDAMHRQLQSLSFASLFDATHSPAERLCDKLVELSGGAMQTVYLSTTGSSAVDVALRVARLHHRTGGRPDKQRILHFDSGYHGSAGLGLHASGILAAELARWEERPPGFQALPSPRDEDASMRALAAALEQDAERIACLIMEPVLGSAGVIVPSRAYCEAVSRLCARHDVLLVADEVATGGGRCGAMFASTLLGLAPDIVTLSKGINSGYFPLGATLFSARVMAPIVRAGAPLQYGSTQDGNPVGCIAALVTLNTVQELGLCERATALGEACRARLRGNGTDGVVREVRGLGMMTAIELAHLDAARTPFSAAESAVVRRQCMDAGLLTYHFDSGISLFPALTLRDDEAATMTDILDEVFTTLF
jgi:adenosylmethionine-8-amino-7-oxononanoate aminotransferase